MQNELFKAIKEINIANLTEDDKEELLRIFVVTESSLVRDRIALIFSDLRYNPAVPFIIKKIKAKNVIGNNGTLIHSLTDLDAKKYFLEFINMICIYDYEARLGAYGIVEIYANSISESVRKKALEILENQKRKQGSISADNYENSTLHFIESTITQMIMLNYLHSTRSKTR